MVQEMLKVSQEGMNFGQSMTTTIEKSIASCFEKISENLTALFKQQLNVCALPHTENVMEVEGDNSVPQSLYCDPKPLILTKSVILLMNMLTEREGKTILLFIIYRNTILNILSKL